MKKWIFPVLILFILNIMLPLQVHAWPWSKKDKEVTQTTNSTSTVKNENTEPDEPKVVENKTYEASKPAESPTPRVQVKSPLTDEVNGLKVEDPVISSEIPPDKTYVAVDDPKNPLGVTISAQKLNESAQLIGDKKYKEAEKILLPLKDWLVEATEAHINLHKTLKTIPSAQIQAELEKQLALQFALLRDKAFFQMGMLAIGQGDFPSAIKNLSKVIQSQPKSAMGAQAYDVLQKIGFTEKIQLRDVKKEDKQANKQTP